MRMDQDQGLPYFGGMNIHKSQLFLMWKTGFHFEPSVSPRATLCRICLLEGSTEDRQLDGDLVETAKEVDPQKCSWNHGMW